MASVCQAVMAEVKDTVGRLAELTEAVRNAGLNIRAICAWVNGSTGKMLLVTDDAGKACKAVSPLVDACSFDECVCVELPNEPGALGKVARKLADAGISIRIVYATAGNVPKAAVVLHTSDNARAAALL